MNRAVSVRLLAGLARQAGSAPPDGRLELADGETVASLGARCGVDPAAVGTALVNGRPAGPEARLAPGDDVVFVPPITGG